MRLLDAFCGCSMQLAVFHVSFGYLMQLAVIQCSKRLFNAVCGYSMRPAVIHA